jgi:predicted phage baseplate assembly protein
LYLGFANDLSGHLLDINLNCRTRGFGVVPKDPPLVWETWSGLNRAWIAVVVEQDDTGGFNKDGRVVVRLPYDAGPALIENRSGFCWVRARLVESRPGQGVYSDSPRITGVAVDSLAGTIPASQSIKIVGEAIGTSDGSPGQRFNLQTAPILPRREGETLEVQDDDGVYQPWIEVQDFGASGPNDPHFVLDDATGTVELGPRIRSPKGEEQQYGRVPPLGRRLRFSRYRSGGGVFGNVGARTITVLQSSIPYVASVTNEAAAIGGTDTEDIEHAKWRAPQVLRSSERAVTPDDFEFLAREATPGIARARCVAAGDGGGGPGEPPPGTIRLQLVPSIPNVSGPITREETDVTPRIREEVRGYLDDRRLLGTELVLDSPTYTWVTAIARLRARPRASRSRITTQAAETIYRFVHPTTGGPEGTGWPFGRELFAGEIYSILQAIDGVDFVEEVVLHSVNPQTREFGPAATRVAPADGGLLCSFEHRIRVE